MESFFVELQQLVEHTDLDWIGQANALIRQYLHKKPANDIETWAKEVRQALWLEKRYWESWTELLTGIVKAVFGKN